MNNDNSADEFNPFAPPLAELQAVSVKSLHEVPPGLWRDGKLLVIARGAPLPRRCIKSNAPAAEKPLRRNLAWHHPAIYFTLLIGLIIYVVVAIVMTKRAAIDIWLSEHWRRKRRNRIAIAWTAVLCGMASIVAGMATIGTSESRAGGMILVGLLTVVGSAIYGLMSARMVVATRITDSHIWLKGAHADFLAQLPDASGG